MVKVDLSGISEFVDPMSLDYASAAAAHRALFEKTGEGSDVPFFRNSGKYLTIYIYIC